MKDLDSNQDGKMGHEMRTVTEMKDAARRLTKSEMLSHKRSPGGGRVMKSNRETPSKLNNVRKLRKMFELDASSPTRGCTELLTQPSVGLNPGNPSTTTRCAGLELKICVDQPRRGVQTGPRQTGELGLRLSQDWSSQTRLGLGDQPGEL